MYRNLIPTSHAEAMIEICNNLIPVSDTGQQVPHKIIHWNTYYLLERLMGTLIMIPAINNNKADYRFLNQSVAHLARALALDMMQSLYYLDVWESNMSLTENEREQKMNDAAFLFAMDYLHNNAYWLRESGLSENDVISLFEGSVGFKDGKVDSINNYTFDYRKIEIQTSKHKTEYCKLKRCYKTLNKICHFSLLGGKLSFFTSDINHPITEIFNNLYFHLWILTILESSLHEDVSIRQPLIEQIIEMRKANNPS